VDLSLVAWPLMTPVLTSSVGHPPTVRSLPLRAEKPDGIGLGVVGGQEADTAASERDGAQVWAR